MQRQFLFFLMLCGVILQATAQDGKATRKLVVADIETRVPMRDVIVSTKDGYRDTTNWRGICYVPNDFDTLTVAKASYIPERIVRGELRDSTFLIPSGSAIGEVTVWGKDKIGEKVDEWKRYTPLPVGGSGMAFDFAKLIDGRTRRDRKHLRNVRKKFAEMDKYDDDPIVNAYKKAMEEERAKTEGENAEASK